MVLDWDNEKSNKLKAERNICFEDIVIAIEDGGLVDLINHPNPDKYPDQKVMLVRWADYIYMIPCVKTKNGFFLKTIFPSRKATKDYFTERNE
jgi:hypothetical protein